MFCALCFAPYMQRYKVMYIEWALRWSQSFDQNFVEVKSFKTHKHGLE